MTVLSVFAQVGSINTVLGSCEYTYGTHKDVTLKTIGGLKIEEP